MNEDQSTPGPDEGQEQGEPRFSFTDKRKVDPADGSVRPLGEPAPAPEQAAASDVQAGTAEDPSGDHADAIDAEAAELYTQTRSEDQQRIEELEKQVVDLTEELKRDQAEYVNSRRRIEASAEAGKLAAAANVLSSLIGVLDEIALGRQHGDIAEGTPFHSISGKLEDAVAAHGMARFGATGDEFDPNLHEALMHEDSDEVAVPTVKMVMQPGYRMDDRVLRPARVATHGPQ